MHVSKCRVTCALSWGDPQIVYANVTLSIVLPFGAKEHDLWQMIQYICTAEHVALHHHPPTYCTPN